MGGLPTKPKIQGYITAEVFAKFQDYCKLHGLSQSAGLETVIAGFFGISPEVKEPLEKTNISVSNILATEISKLNDRVGILERWKLDVENISADVSNANLSCLIANPAAYLNGAVANLSANLASSANNLTDLVADTFANLASVDADTPQALEAQAPEEAITKSVNFTDLVTELDVAPEAPSTPPHPPAALTQKQLAARLKVNQSTLWRHHSDLLQWSKSRDPDGIAWERRSVKRGMPQYYPILDEENPYSTWDTKVESFLGEVGRRA